MNGWYWVFIIGGLWIVSIIVVIVISNANNGKHEDKMSDAWLERKRRENER